MSDYYNRLENLSNFLKGEGIPLNSAEAYMQLIGKELLECKVALEYAENYIHSKDPSDPRIAIADAVNRALDHFEWLFDEYENGEPITKAKEPFFCDGYDFSNLPQVIIEDVNYCATRNPEREEFEPKEISSWLKGYDWIVEHVDKKIGLE